MNLIKRLNFNREQVNNILLVLGTKILDTESTIPLLHIPNNYDLNPAVNTIIDVAGDKGFRVASYIGATCFAYLIRNNFRTLKFVAGVQAYFAFNNLLQYSLYQAQQMPIQ